MEKRKEVLLNGGRIVLAIEGRYTNLVISPNCKNGFCFRVDKLKEYNAPLPKAIDYIENRDLYSFKAVSELSERWGFDNSTLDDLDEILEITKNMQERKMLDW